MLIFPCYPHCWCHHCHCSFLTLLIVFRLPPCCHSPFCLQTFVITVAAANVVANCCLQSLTIPLLPVASVSICLYFLHSCCHWCCYSFHNWWINKKGWAWMRTTKLCKAKDIRTVQSQPMPMTAKMEAVPLPPFWKGGINGCDNILPNICMKDFFCGFSGVCGGVATSAVTTGSLGFIEKWETRLMDLYLLSWAVIGRGDGWHTVHFLVTGSIQQDFCVFNIWIHILCLLFNCEICTFDWGNVCNG